MYNNFNNEKMSFNFKPLNTEEYLSQTVGLMPGNYVGKISNVEVKTSKSNQLMLVITIKFSGKKGATYVLKCWLLPENEKMAYFFKDFMDCLGLQEIYESGQIEPSILLGKELGCKIKHIKDEDGNSRAKITGFYHAVEAGFDDVPNF